MLWATALVFCQIAVCLCFDKSTSCKENNHCPDGYYCDIDGKCVQCLNCEDLKRKALTPMTCVKTVAECGPCFKGLVDRGGDINANCVPPDADVENEGLPTYVWVVIAIVSLLLFLVALIVVVRCMRNLNLFKVLLFTDTNTSNGVISFAPTEMEAQPRYNPGVNVDYAPVRGTSPPPYDFPSHLNTGVQDLPEGQVKRPHAAFPQDSREMADRQMARVYRRPEYEDTSPRSPTSPNELHQEEETLESTWTPSNNNNEATNNKNNAVALQNATVTVDGPSSSNTAQKPEGNLSALLATARDTTVVVPPPAKKSRNYEYDDSSSSGGSMPQSPSPTPQATPLVVVNNNVVTNSVFVKIDTAKRL